MNLKSKTRYIQWFEDLCMNDVADVGGKNASLGELIQTLKSKGIKVPEGFATNAKAYWLYASENNLEEAIKKALSDFHSGKCSLAETGKQIRALFLNAEFPQAIADEIKSAYQELSQRYQQKNSDVAVRSSATAEDLPDASFAGQQESFLNISGEQELLEACRQCFASLFTDRAIAYREEKGFDHMKIALSVGVQKMVRSDKAGYGVMFSIDTETGFPRAVLINAAWGLGENIVKGVVTPDEYRTFKPLLDNSSLCPIIEKTLGTKEQKMIYGETQEEKTRNIPTSETERQSFVLSDQEILTLSKWAVIIENQYHRPMDIEWAKDGESQELFIVQARPETVHSQRTTKTLKSYSLKQKGTVLLSGISIGNAITTGKVCIVENSKDIEQFQEGSILVAQMTEPDWVPLMKHAKGIITDFGGRTCHAAIVSREFGIPSIVGTQNATTTLRDNQEITLSCAEGEEGYIYEGILPYEETTLDLGSIPTSPVNIMMNIADPSSALQWWDLPCQGIGLARMEFIISNLIKIHPMALVNFDHLEDSHVRAQIEHLTQRYAHKSDYFVEQLALGIAKIAASRYPQPVIVRTSDFKTNEYAALIGGAQFETPEANPMLGFRGASRYYSSRYQEGFALECKAIKWVRDIAGLTNVIVMIPFCRTLEEAHKVQAVMAENGLVKGQNGLEIYMMSEIPSNVILAEEFATLFNGFSIGSNDLTQLALGIDRESVDLAYLFDERNDAVNKMIVHIIQAAKKAGCKVGICGQAPSDYPEFAKFLVNAGIDSISLNPDSIINTIRYLADESPTQ